jgi:DHA1 family bicyclomycin/chloramphenicol resistance-like MFS transporter
MLARTPDDDNSATASAVVRPTTRHGWRLLGTLSLLMGFASISTDLYLPAMPVMGASLGTTVGTIEWTVSGYLIGFTVGQLLWGPISDRYGRRIPVAIGIILFVIGSAGCALADSGASMIEWRLVQAVGASAGVVLSRAMVRDLYQGRRAAQMLSTLITVMAVAPLIGPSLGGQVLLFAGWRAIFWVLVVIGLLTLVALLTLPETLHQDKRSQGPVWRSLWHYGALLRQRRIMAYAGAGGFFYAGMFAYVAGTPFAYIDFHHLPAQLYGLLFAAGMVGIMATNMINMRLVTRFGSDRMMVAGTALAAVAAVIVAVAAWTNAGGLWGIAAPLFLFASATGFIVANSIAGALNASPLRSGAVSALIGAFQYGSGIIGSGLVGLLADGTPWPMGLVIALGGLGSLLCALLLPRSAPLNGQPAE